MQIIKKGIFVILVLISCKSLCQSSLQDSLAYQRINLSKNHLFILGAWAGANIIQGSISASNAVGNDHYFHQMNAYWNTVNLAIAGAGLLAAHQQLKRHYSLVDNLREQQKIEKLLLLNTGLDAAYITTGLYLKERGTRLNKDQPIGYGNSLVFQGAFLLVFDLFQYAANRKNGKILDQMLGNWQLGTTQNGIGLSYQFK